MDQVGCYLTPKKKEVRYLNIRTFSLPVNQGSVATGLRWGCRWVWEQLIQGQADHAEKMTADKGDACYLVAFSLFLWIQLSTPSDSTFCLPFF